MTPRNPTAFFCTFSAALARLGLMLAMMCLTACATTGVPKVPIATAWSDIDLAEANLKKATRGLQDALLGAAKDMNITNCGDLGNTALRQSLLHSLQAIQSANPPMASAARLARTRVQGAIQDLRRDAGALQLGMVELVAALERGEENPANRGDIAKVMTRIKVEAEGASGLIYYAEQITSQLQRLGG